MNLFYAPGLSGSTYMLDENESKHAVQVLRLKVTDKIRLMDGNGNFYDAEILSAHPKKCEVTISSSTTVSSRKLHLHIAVAPTKMNDRLEWFLEKATEIGVDEITPVICERSERRATNHERFDKVIVTAMKQSLQPFKPILHEQQTLSAFLNESPPGFIAHCAEGERMELKKCSFHSPQVTILIGPEGDFTNSEIDAAIAAGWIPVSLGTSRLRTETAALVAVHTVNLLFEQ